MSEANFSGGRLATDLTLGMHQVGSEVYGKSVLIDPATGEPLNATAVVSGASLWSIPSSGFASPRYLAADPTDATGFDISGASSLIMALEGTYSGAAGALEQTLDESGVSGWFPVLGRPAGSISAPAASGLVSGSAYAFPVRGVRARFRVISLSTGTMSGRFGLSSAEIDQYVAYASNTAGGIALWNRLPSCAGSTNATTAKTSGGRLYEIFGYNAAAAVRYLKVYNKASAPTVGTDTPFLTLALAPSKEFKFEFAGDVGAYLSAGIAYALTTGAPDNDTGAVTAADIVGLNLGYA